jgi:cell division protein FtsB
MISKIFSSFSLHQRWLALFGLWSVFLTGMFASFLGSPGILQAIRLKSLLTEKTEQLGGAQEDLHKLQTEISLLENNRFTQEREIRRVLGYAASDEIIFDFNSQ